MLRIQVRTLRALLFASVVIMLAVVSAQVSRSAPSVAPITQWTSTEPLSLPLSPAAVAIKTSGGSFLVFAGGRDSTGNPVQIVRRARVEASGGIGEWSVQPSLGGPLLNHVLVADPGGRFLFAMTGWNGVNRTVNVWRATVDMDGMIGAWVPLATRNYPLAVASADGLVAGDRVYVVGGSDPTGTPRRTIYSARIALDGSLSTWRAERDLPKGLQRHAVATYGGYLYVTGGDDGTGAQSTIYYARINSDGTLAAWQTAFLPALREYHRAVVQDHRLVVLGGSTDNTTGQATVWRALIGPNGSLGSWETQQPLPRALYRHAVAVVPRYNSEYVFVLGGLFGSDSQTAVYFSSVPQTEQYLPLVARQRTSTPTPYSTNTPTSTPTATRTPTASRGPSSTPTDTPTRGPSPTPTATDTPTRGPSPTPTATASSTLTPTRTPTATQTPTRTPSPTGVATPTPTPTTGACVRTIAGTVYEDVNNNGVPDPGEARLSGVTITLTGPGTNLSTSTNSQGTYYFANLAAGTFEVRETQPVGYTSLSPDIVTAAVPDCPSQAIIVDFRETMATPTPTPTSTSTYTPTPTLTPTPTNTPTPTATRTSTPTPTRTATPTPTVTPTSMPTPVIGDTILVPAGSFEMGCDPDHNGGLGCPVPETPKHTVFLDAYRIDRTEVTNTQYRDCETRGACTPPTNSSSRIRPQYYGNPAFGDYPVIWVTWQQAAAYCQWAGKRLPTEAEWEKAARGSTVRAYPWGDQAPSCSLANYQGCPTGDTVAVGTYPSGASPYGALDMAGNVHEWVADWYGSTYYFSSPPSNPPGPASGSERVMRGGGFWNATSGIRTAFRDYLAPNTSSDGIGFRCAS